MFRRGFKERFDGREKPVKTQGRFCDLCADEPWLRKRLAASLVRL